MSHLTRSRAASHRGAHRSTTRTGRALLATAVGFAITFTGAAPATAAEAPVDLGSAGAFAVLAGSTITNTGASELNGDLGLSPGTSVTGFPPGVVNGEEHVTDADAADGQTDLTTAYNDAAGRTTTDTIVANLGGQTLTPGVYAGGALAITGTLTLDAEGDPDAVFIFKAASTLTTASGSDVALINEASACNVFWQVTSSATLGTNSDFAGTIMALSAITANTGASVDGGLLARNAAVTLDVNDVTVSACPAAVPATTTTTSTTLPAVTTTSTTAVGAVTTSTTATSNPEGTTTTVGGAALITTTTLSGGSSTGLLPRTGSGLTAIAVPGAIAVLLGILLVRTADRRQRRAR